MPYISQRELEQLKEIHRITTLATANFYSNTNCPVILKSGNQIDAFVKDSIRLWITTWVESPLAEIIRRLEEKK